MAASSGGARAPVRTAIGGREATPVRYAVVYGLLGVFFASERVLRRGAAAASLEAAAADRGSTQAIGQAFGVAILALLAAPMLNVWRIGTLPRRRALFGVGMTAMLAGLGARTWAMRALGASYTRTLRLVPEQRVVQDGPYKVIRHPGYLGTLLVWLGAAVALANAIVVAVAGAAVLPAYARRMRAEEAMLQQSFGGQYRDYMRHTWRLVPLVY